MGLHRRVKLCMYSSPLHAVIPRTCQALLWVATMGLHPQSRQTLTFVPDSWTADLFSGTLGTPRNACTPSHRRQNILSEPKRSRFRRFGRGKGGKPINIAGWPASRRRRNRLFPVIRPWNDTVVSTEAFIPRVPPEHQRKSDGRPYRLTPESLAADDRKLALKKSDDSFLCCAGKNISRAPKRNYFSVAPRRRLWRERNEQTTLAHLP